MRFTRIFNEILKPIFIITLFAVMISLLVECYGFISIFDLCISFDSIVQIEIFLLTILITVLTIRIALIDNELKAIREKINKIFDQYGYYGHLLFEEKMDDRINDLLNILQNKINAHIKIREAILNRKKIESFQEQYKKLKQFRQEHIEAIRPISILIALLIVACLILSIFDLNYSIVILLSLKISAIGVTIYTIYESIDATLHILTNPFTKND
jgi:small-conductance mechanosensitive channel